VTPTVADEMPAIAEAVEARTQEQDPTSVSRPRREPALSGDRRRRSLRLPGDDRTRWRRAVRGTHGRLPADTADAPVLLCSDQSVARDRIAATEVRDLLLELAGVPAQV
jgi:hypothetical protein